MAIKSDCMSQWELDQLTLDSSVLFIYGQHIFEKKNDCSHAKWWKLTLKMQFVTKRTNLKFDRLFLNLISFFPIIVFEKMATARDRLILNAIVNPLLPLGEGVFDDDKLLPDELKDNEPNTDLVK